MTVQQITTDLDSEIGLDKTYTHAISGGEAGTVNGVFEALEPTITPVNFNWELETPKAKLTRTPPMGPYRPFLNSSPS